MMIKQRLSIRPIRPDEIEAFSDWKRQYRDRLLWLEGSENSSALYAVIPLVRNPPAAIQVVTLILERNATPDPVSWAGWAQHLIIGLGPLGRGATSQAKSLDPADSTSSEKPLSAKPRDPSPGKLRLIGLETVVLEDDWCPQDVVDWQFMGRYLPACEAGASEVWQVLPLRSYPPYRTTMSVAAFVQQLCYGGVVDPTLTPLLQMGVSIDETYCYGQGIPYVLVKQKTALP